MLYFFGVRKQLRGIVKRLEEDFGPQNLLQAVLG